MAKGQIKYNNGEKEIFLYPDDPIPEGFVRGGLKYSEEYKKELKEKQRKAIIERFGSWEAYVEYRNKETEKTQIKKYGSVEAARKANVKKIQNTMLDRYGVISNFQLEDTKEKKKENMIRKIRSR